MKKLIAYIIFLMMVVMWAGCEDDFFDRFNIQPKPFPTDLIKPEPCDSTLVGSDCYKEPEKTCDETDPKSDCYVEPKPCDPMLPGAECCDKTNPEHPCYEDPEKPCDPMLPGAECCDKTNPEHPCYEKPCDETDPKSDCYKEPPCDPMVPGAECCNPKNPAHPCYEPPCDPADPYGECWVDPCIPYKSAVDAAKTVVDMAKIDSISAHKRVTDTELKITAAKSKITKLVGDSISADAQIRGSTGVDCDQSPAMMNACTNPVDIRAKYSTYGYFYILDNGLPTATFRDHVTNITKINPGVEIDSASNKAAIRAFTDWCWLWLNSTDQLPPARATIPALNAELVTANSLLDAEKIKIAAKRATYVTKLSDYNRCLMDYPR